MADKTSLIIKSVDTENKATSRSITDVSKTATNLQLKAFAQALNATSTNTYQSSSRVQTTDLDSAQAKLPRNLALWKSDDGGDNYQTIQPAMSNADVDKWFDVRYDGNDPCYIDFGSTADQFTATFFGGETTEGGQYSGVSWTTDKGKPFETQNPVNFTVKVYVPETTNYESAEMTITLTGGNS